MQDYDAEQLYKGLRCFPSESSVKNNEGKTATATDLYYTKISSAA